ncbi:MAG: hypothetical protein AB7I30_08865, partial [Isosphaeraceae bacterium]
DAHMESSQAAGPTFQGSTVVALPLTPSAPSTLRGALKRLVGDDSARATVVPLHALTPASFRAKVSSTFRTPHGGLKPPAPGGPRRGFGRPRGAGENP